MKYFIEFLTIYREYQCIDNKFRSFNNTFFDKRISISIFNKKLKFSIFSILIILFTLSFTASLANNILNNDYHSSINLFVVIIDSRRFLIDIEKIYNREHKRS